MPVNSRARVNATTDFGIIPALSNAGEYSRSTLPNGHLILYLCPSSNPPSVLGGISLSSQPEQVQDLLLDLALLHSGRHFHFSIS